MSEFVGFDPEMRLVSSILEPNQLNFRSKFCWLIFHVTSRQPYLAILSNCRVDNELDTDLSEASSEARNLCVKRRMSSSVVGRADSAEIDLDLSIRFANRFT